MKHLRLFTKIEDFNAQKEQIPMPWIAVDASTNGVFFSNVTEKPEETEDDIELVDLGLPSGTLWGKYNMGANSEYEYGKYYAFGDVVGFYADEAPANAGLWSNHPFNRGAETFDAEYFREHMFEWMTLSPNSPNTPNEKFPDMIVTEERLKPEYDAATVAYGAAYHIPTVEDWDELQIYCDCVWDGDNNCINVVSKVNGNHIVIPLAGDFSDFSGGELEYAAEMGNYWSSTHYTDVDNYGGCYWDSSYQVMFSEYKGSADAMMIPFPMNIAQSIRPVKKA